MRQILSILFDLILINLIPKFFCQSSSKNFNAFLNYSSKDNLYYIQLYLDEFKTPQKFLLDSTFPFISIYCNNLTYKKNCPEENECFVNKQISINNTLNKNQHDDNEEISFNADIKYNINGNNMSEIKGILGLNNGNETLVDILYDLNVIDEKIFSICLSKKNGYLGLGQILGIYTYVETQQEINFINLLPSTDNLFEMEINYLKINNIKIEKEFISYLDTSTSHTFFPKNLYDQIITYLLLINNNLKKNTNNEFCQIIPKEEKNIFYNNFPDIIVNFKNFIYVWKPKNYFYENNTNVNNQINVCLTFRELNNSNNNIDTGNSKIILGTDFIQDYEIVFDKNKQKIAFINTECDKLFSDLTKGIKSSNIYENSEAISDNYEITSDLNYINNNHLSSNIIETNENKSDEDYEILISDSISNTQNTVNILDTSNSSDNIINDLLINDTYVAYSTDYIPDFSTNIMYSTYNEENTTNDTTYETINNNISTTNEIIIPTTQKINKLENNHKIEIETTEIPKKIETTIITEKAEINIIQTTLINNPTTYNNEEDNEEENINEKEQEKENERLNTNTQITKEHSTRNGFYEVLKSFMKNKLIYFLVAFLGVVFAFVFIIFISCAIISCVKYIQNKRRDYMEQVDVELPRYSKNMSSFSDRDN